MVSTFISSIQKAFATGLQCHTLSDSVWWGAYCASLMKLVPDYYSFFYKYYYLNATQGFLNTPFI